MKTSEAIKLCIFLGQNSKTISLTGFTILALLKEKPRTLDELTSLFPGVSVEKHMINLFPLSARNRSGSGLAARKNGVFTLTVTGRAFLTSIL